MKNFFKNVPWGKVLGYGLQAIGSVLTGSDGSNMSNHRGNTYRGNTYRGNKFKSNRRRNFTKNPR